MSIISFLTTLHLSKTRVRRPKKKVHMSGKNHVKIIKNGSNKLEVPILYRNLSQITHG